MTLIARLRQNRAFDGVWPYSRASRFYLEGVRQPAQSFRCPEGASQPISGLRRSNIVTSRQRPASRP